MLRKVIAMPGRLMYDGKDPDLFDHFSVVAQRLGVYTVRDYADIVRHLVDTWKIGARSVSGKAARAQEFLCKHAERIDAQAEKAASRLAEESRVPVSWTQTLSRRLVPTQKPSLDPHALGAHWVASVAGRRWPAFRRRTLPTALQTVGDNEIAFPRQRPGLPPTPRSRVA